jgi:hypothetical protein
VIKLDNYKRDARFKLSGIREKEIVMKSTEITLPELAMIAGTRGLLGAGAALLISSKLNNDERRAVGWTLLLIGLISTVPLAINVFSKRR